MTRHLLTSASALAILATATPAFAQANNTRDITTAGGTNNIATCDNTTGSNNACVITQRDGDNNFSDIDQFGDGNRATNEQTGSNNDSDIDQTGPTSADGTALGAGNSATVLQTSAFPRSTDAAFNANSSTVAQTGVRNVAGVTQSNTSTSTTTAANATVGTGAGGNTSNGNVSSVTQVSATDVSTGGVANAGNFVRVDQGAGNNRLGQSSTITQNGGSQSATVNQLFAGNFSTIRQGVAGATADAASSGNRAAVSQNGQAGTSTIAQDNRNNTALVTLGNGATNSAGGAATIGASSSVTQSQSGNTATVFITGGGQTANSTSPVIPAGQTTAPTSQNNNQSVLIQRNTTVGVGTNANGTASAAELANVRNDAFVSLTRGQQQSSSVTQDGIQNFADVTVTSGVAGFDPGASATDPTRGRSGGNTSTINQTGRGNSAVVTTGSDRSTTAPQGFGNSVSITQTATQQYQGRGETTASRNFQSEGRFVVTEPTLGAAGTARGIFVQTFQTGRFGTVTINQSDNANGAGTAYPDGTIGRARGDVVQSGERHNLSLTQVGDNFASLTQGQIGIGSNNSLTVNQTDAGEGTGAVSTTGSGTDEFGNPTGGGSSQNTTGRAYNVAVVTQYGSNNTMTVDQNTRNGFVSAFQATNTSGNVIDVDQVDAAGATEAAGTLSRGNTANVSQFANNNAADVDQTGSRNVITVEQRGVGAAAATTTSNTAAAGTTPAASGNLVTVLQSGNDNRGRVVQGAGVGRSATFDAGDPATATTAQNAEARLIQSGNSNSGSIEQNGRGQRAEINQSGNNNTAGILQEAAATNASATINQTGSRNTFYIRQNAVNQQLTVTQSGNDNSVTTRTPATGGGFGGTTPQ